MSNCTGSSPIQFPASWGSTKIPRAANRANRSGGARTRTKASYVSSTSTPGISVATCERGACTIATTGGPDEGHVERTWTAGIARRTRRGRTITSARWFGLILPLPARLPAETGRDAQKGFPESDGRGSDKATLRADRHWGCLEHAILEIECVVIRTVCAAPDFHAADSALNVRIVHPFHLRVDNRGRQELLAEAAKGL